MNDPKHAELTAKNIARQFSKNVRFRSNNAIKFSRSNQTEIQTKN